MFRYILGSVLMAVGVTYAATEAQRQLTAIPAGAFLVIIGLVLFVWARVAGQRG
jgi:sulfite exporter TauE/SafE